MSKWPLTRLDELIDVKHGFAFKGHEITTDKTECVLVTPGNFAIGGGWKDSKKYLRGYPPDEYKFSPGDLVVTMTDLSKETDTLGYSAKIPNDGKIYAHNQRVGRVEIKEGDPEFLYWLMRTREYQWHCVASASGTSVMHTSPSRIKEFEFNCPPLQEQEAIAKVLSSLDDKIDLLKRQNKTLEGMAEALFRQWFIEEAQDDWEEISIYDTCSVTYGFPFKSKQFNDDQVGTPILRIRDLKNGVCGVSSLEACEDKYIIDKGDLVAGMDGEFRLYQWSGSRCHLNQRVCKFTPNQSFGSFFCYFSIGKALQYFERVKVGTTVIHLGKGDIDSIAFKVPSRFRVEEFNRQTRPYWNRINCNNELIGNLSAQRDTLLPKLMSGEVRVQMD